MIKALIILLVILLLAGGGVFVWRTYMNAPLSLDEGVVTDPAIEALVANIRRIKNIRLDTSLFSDPIFRQLRAPRLVYPDTGTGTGTLIPPVANVGRENPFAPF